MSGSSRTERVRKNRHRGAEVSRKHSSRHADEGPNRRANEPVPQSSPRIVLREFPRTKRSTPARGAANGHRTAGQPTLPTVAPMRRDHTCNTIFGHIGSSGTRRSASSSVFVTRHRNIGIAPFPQNLVVKDELELVFNHAYGNSARIHRWVHDRDGLRCEHRRRRREMFVPLTHPPAHAAVQRISLALPHRGPVRAPRQGQ